MNVQNWTRGSNAIAAAMTLCVAVALFAWGGHALDGWLGTSPWLLVLGAALGALGGFIYLLNALAPDLLPWGRKPPDRAPPGDPPHDHAP